MAGLYYNENLGLMIGNREFANSLVGFMPVTVDI